MEYYNETPLHRRPRIRLRLIIMVLAGFMLLGLLLGTCGSDSSASAGNCRSPSLKRLGAGFSRLWGRRYPLTRMVSSPSQEK